MSMTPSSDGPSASVVVPTRNRADLIARFLPSLAAQEVAEPYEVIVADNGSTDETPAVVEELSRRWPHVRSVRETRPGGARARHAGALAARSPLLIFVDDDMRADPRLVAAHLCAHRESPGGVVVGDIASAPGPHPFDRMMAYIYDGPKRTLAGRAPGVHDYWSGNASLGRDLYLRLGGYTGALAELRCGEDMEFGLRLKSAGVSVRFAPEAVTHHHFTERFGARLDRAYRVGVAWAYLNGRYPGLQIGIAEPARGRWRARAVELACRAFARAAEPFDRGRGVPCVPLAYAYALGLRTATGRGIADYYAGRTPLRRRLEGAPGATSLGAPPAGGAD
jgi:glycosyltransferase involved in cell wall biosynthesis